MRHRNHVLQSSTELVHVESDHSGGNLPEQGAPHLSNAPDSNADDEPDHPIDDDPEL